MGSEQKYELADNNTLEKKLSIELSKIEVLVPIRPIAEIDVQEIKTSSLNKSVILASYNNPTVNQYPELALRFKLLISINKTIMFVGFDVKDISFLYRGVFDYVREEQKNLTIEELDIAFKLGALGEYGEWHGLSAMTFCKWIKCYVNQTRRQAMIDKHNLLKDKSKEVVLSEEEETENRISWLKSVIELYKKYVESKDKDFPYYDYQSRLYDFLAKLKIIAPSVKKRERYKEQAKFLLRKVTKRKIDNVDIVLEAKKIALAHWFRTCKKHNVDLEKLIEEKNGWEFLKNNKSL